MKAKMTRRVVLHAATAGAIFYLAFATGLALAQTPQVDPAGARAGTLEYTHESSTAGKNCANSKLCTGEASNEWEFCVGPGVAGAGWCMARVAKG